MFQHSDPTTPPSYSFDVNPSGPLPFYGYKTTPIFFGGESGTNGGNEQVDNPVIKRSLTPPNLRRPLPISAALSRGHSPPRHPIYARLRREEALLHSEVSEATFTQRVADEDMLCRLLTLNLAAPSDTNPLGEAVSNRRSFLRSASFGFLRNAPQRKAPSVALHSSPVAPRLPKPSLSHASSHGLSAVPPLQSLQQSTNNPNSSAPSVPVLVTPIHISGLSSEPSAEPNSAQIRTPRCAGTSSAVTNPFLPAATTGSSIENVSSNGIDSSSSGVDASTYQFPVGVPPRSSSAPPIPCDEMT